MNHIDRRKAHLALPAGLGLGGAVATLIAGGLNWAAGGMAIVLAVTGVAIGLQLAAMQKTLLQSIDAYLTEQQQFGRAVALAGQHKNATRHALSNMTGGASLRCFDAAAAFAS